jgi:hypothetical protein
MRIYIGTSGFSYAPWRGSFYPEKLPAAQMLAYYAERLDAVEINKTFYRMPAADMLAKWAGDAGGVPVRPKSRGASRTSAVTDVGARWRASPRPRAPWAAAWAPCCSSCRRPEEDLPRLQRSSPAAPAAARRRRVPPRVVD